MTRFILKFAAYALLCGGAGAVLAVAGGVRPERPLSQSALVAATLPILGLRPGPELASVIAPGSAREAHATKPEKPRRIKPHIDLSPVATRLNDAGFALISETEGLRLKAYFLAGQWLVGYGHARIAYEGLEITRAEAEALLHRDIHEVERGLAPLLAGIEVNENEYAALVSLAYNMGVGGFQRSLVYQRLAAGDRQGAADAFRYLTTAKIDGVRTELPVLVMRRERERDLFLSGPERLIEATDILPPEPEAEPEPTET